MGRYKPSANFENAAVYLSSPASSLNGMSTAVKLEVDVFVSES